MTDVAATSVTASGFDAQEVALRALLSGIVGRDEADLAKLYDTTVSRVYALALRISGDAAGAEEVVSDVYMQVWEQAQRYDPKRSKVMHWLYMVCRSRALDYLRRRDPAQTAPESDALRSEPPVDETHPEEVLMAIEKSSAMYAALRSLNPSQRQLVALAFFRDMSHREIAERTGIPLGTVKSMLRRSMGALREALQSPQWEARHGKSR